MQLVNILGNGTRLNAAPRPPFRLDSKLPLLPQPGKDLSLWPFKWPLDPAVNAFRLFVGLYLDSRQIKNLFMR